MYIYDDMAFKAIDLANTLASSREAAEWGLRSVSEEAYLDEFFVRLRFCLSFIQRG